MDKRVQLIDALKGLSKQADLVADLLSADIACDMSDEIPLAIATDNSKMIDVNLYKQWPDASMDNLSPESRARMSAVRIPTMDNMTILEFVAGPNYPISIYHPLAKVDLVTDSFKFNQQPYNVKIIHLEEANHHYDLGVIWDSLEFVSDPAKILLEFKRRCRKTIVRFRPWTSRDGAFQSTYFNKAFAHLVMDLDHQVKFKVIRPLATYDSLFKTLGMTIDTRKVNGLNIEDYMLTREIMSVIVARTWGKLSFDEAAKIMTTDTVDYTVSAA